MKRVYERPAMTAEIFETNAYCGACANQPPVLTGELIVDLADGNWYSNNNGKLWNGDASKYVTRHVFVEDNKESMKSNFGNLDQYYWQCSCCSEGSHYYLEYSANFTENYNHGNPTFFLYREDTRNSTLQLASAESWPSNTSKTDECVAQVKYSVGSNPVVNS